MAFGAAFVYAGIKTAPKFSAALAVVLGTLGAMISSLLMLSALSGHNWAGSVTAAAGAVSAVATCVAAIKEGGFD